jgi:hypothetical protein
LEAPLTFEWHSYIVKLVSNFIKLKKEDDSLYWSKNVGTGEYTKQLMYATIMEARFSDENQWWWTILWKLHTPKKSKITMWLALTNKLLTRENALEEILA